MPPLNAAPTAPVWRRLVALVYDSLILAAIAFGYTAALTLIAGTRSSDYRPTIAGPWVTLGLLLCLAGFYVYFWRKSGQTVGMRAWQLKLVASDGGVPSWGRLWLRALLGMLGLAAAGIGYIWCWFDPAGNSLPDRLAGVRVLVTPQEKKS